MKEVTIHVTWKSTHTLEVPDGFEVDELMSGKYPEVTDQIDSSTAELVDWK